MTLNMNFFFKFKYNITEEEHKDRVQKYKAAYKIAVFDELYTRGLITLEERDTAHKDIVATSITLELPKKIDTVYVVNELVYEGYNSYRTQTIGVYTDATKAAEIKAEYEAEWETEKEKSKVYDKTYTIEKTKLI